MSWDPHRRTSVPRLTHMCTCRHTCMHSTWSPEARSASCSSEDPQCLRVAPTCPRLTAQELHPLSAQAVPSLWSGCRDGGALVPCLVQPVSHSQSVFHSLAQASFCRVLVPQHQRGAGGGHLQRQKGTTPEARALRQPGRVTWPLSCAPARTPGPSVLGLWPQPRGFHLLHRSSRSRCSSARAFVWLASGL